MKSSLGYRDRLRIPGGGDSGLDVMLVDKGGHIECVLPVRSAPSRSFVTTFFQLSSFALRLKTSSMPAEESIATTERSGKDFLISAVTVPTSQPSSRTAEE